MVDSSLSASVLSVFVSRFVAARLLFCVDYFPFLFESIFMLIAL